GLAGGVAARPDRALHLGAAGPGRGPRAAVAGLLPRGRAAAVGYRPGAYPRPGGHPPRPDARLPDHRRRLLALLHPGPRTRPRVTAGGTRRRLDLRLRVPPAVTRGRVRGPDRK